MAYYKDIDMELTVAQDGDVGHDEDEDAVKNSISNIALTVQGERAMLPSFAYNAHQLLFEPLTEDTANRLAAAMWDAIEFWDNRVIIEGINVNINYDNSQYEVSISFYINNIIKRLNETTIILNQQ